MEKVTLIGTFRNIGADFTHWCTFFNKKRGIGAFLVFSILPGAIAVNCYRLGHYFQTKRLRIFSYPFQLLGIMITGADINPESEIGKGFLLLHSVGTIITGRIGENCIVSALFAFGGDGSRLDIGAGPGLPVIGNNVKVAPGVMMMGPYRVGDGANLAARAGIFKDVPENTLVAGSPARVVRTLAPGESIFNR